MIHVHFSTWHCLTWYSEKVFQSISSNNAMWKNEHLSPISKHFTTDLSARGVKREFLKFFFVQHTSIAAHDFWQRQSLWIVLTQILNLTILVQFTISHKSWTSRLKMSNISNLLSCPEKGSFDPLWPIFASRIDQSFRKYFTMHMQVTVSLSGKI